jgi:pilus assembly protein CpaC
MMRKILLGAAIALFALTSAQAADPREAGARVMSLAVHPGSGTPASQRVTLSLNKALIIQLNADARDVLVSSPDIVDAVVRTPRRIFLLGLKTGQTNAFFFDGAGHQIAALDIRVEKDTVDVGTMMRMALPGTHINVQALNDNIVLSGTVSSAQESARAQDLAARFAGDPAKVVNLLKVAGGEQVMLRVRVAEMQRTIAKQFGLNIATAFKAGGVPIQASTDNNFNLVGRALADASGGQAGLLCTAAAAATAGGTAAFCPPGFNNLSGQLNAFERVGLVHMLAEPNLTAISGETAKFLAGGEFPVPAGRDQQGNISIEFKQFGVALSFTPVVLSAGRISLQVSTEVSELTNTGAFTLAGGTSTDSNGNPVTTGGLTIPALNVRRAQTTVELPSGGSFAIAGLMQHNTSQSIDAFPGLKDLPVLGALFRSRDFQNNETELVVLISAFLVNPTAEANLSLPTDGFVTPSDLDTIVNGKLNDRHGVPGAPAKPSPSGSVGFIVQ